MLALPGHQRQWLVAADLAAAAATDRIVDHAAAAAAARPRVGVFLRLLHQPQLLLVQPVLDQEDLRHAVACCLLLLSQLSFSLYLSLSLTHKLDNG